MKKILLKLLLYCLPFVLILAVFISVEPYDYFYLRKGDSTYLSKPLSSVRELLITRPENIILGDSRMANLNTDYIEEITGEHYQMLGYGGAETGELIQLFWYAAQHTYLKKVVFGIGFYTSVREQGPGRIPEVIKDAENVSEFLLNANYWLDAVNALKTDILNFVFRTAGHDELIEFPENPADYTVMQQIPTIKGKKYRADIEEYCDILCENLGTDSQITDDLIKQLGEVISYCNNNGIELIFVYPPMHEAVFDLVINKLNLQPQIDKYKDFLSENAVVYDMEFINEFTTDDDNFYDGFHLANTKKQYLARMLFTDEEDGNIIRTFPEQ